MKVIDLLNKIANREELPHKIRIKNDILVCNKDYHLPCLQDYYYMDNEEDATWAIWYYDLNDEVEIIEEEPRDIEVCGSLFTRSEYNRLAGIKEDKKIPEKIDEEFFEAISSSYRERIMKDKINEIIDYLEEKE